MSRAVFFIQSFLTYSLFHYKIRLPARVALILSQRRDEGNVSRRNSLPRVLLALFGQPEQLLSHKERCLFWLDGDHRAEDGRLLLDLEDGDEADRHPIYDGDIIRLNIIESTGAEAVYAHITGSSHCAVLVIAPADTTRLSQEMLTAIYRSQAILCPTATPVRLLFRDGTGNPDELRDILDEMMTPANASIS